MPLSLSSCTVGAALVVVELNCTISDISGLSSTDSESISTDVPVADGSFRALVVSIVVVVDVGEDAISVDGIGVDGIGVDDVDDMGDGDDANVVDGVLGGVLFKR